MNRSPDGRVPVLLSAHAEELIASDAEAILHFLRREHPVDAVAATLLRTRRVRRHRAVVRAADTAELVDGLRALIAGNDHPLVARSSESNTPRAAFVFPGQGSQWPSMGAQAYQLPVYRAAVDECADAFVAANADSPVPYLLADAEATEWSETEVQGAQFTHAVGLAQLWMSYGISPDITLGHSLGDIAAAYIAGSIGLTTAVAVVIARARVVAALPPGRYGVAVLGMPAQEAEALIASTPGWLELSVVNARASVAVSGDRDAIRAAVAAASERGVFAREIEVGFPVHTSILEPLRGDLAAQLPQSQFAGAAVQFIGSATASVVDPDVDFGDYWYRNLRHTVRFDRAAAVALRNGATSFVEMSAHPALLFALGDLVGDTPGEPPLMLGSGRRDEPLADVLSANMAAAAVADPDFRWADFVDIRQAPLRGFPNAPMRRMHLWALPEPLPRVPGVTVTRETWEPKEESATRISIRRMAVVDLAGPAGPLADRLRDAIAAHDGALPAEPQDADTIVAVAPLLDHPDAEVAAAEIADLIGAGLLDYVDAIGPSCRDVWLVTVGGEHVRADEPVALPAQTALAAMHRSLGFEYPDQSFRHLDLPSWDIDQPTASTVADTLFCDFTEAALRETSTGPTVYLRTLSDVDPLPRAWPLDGELLEDILITGGNGTVGLHYARYFAERGARRIVLLSRSGVDAATVAELAGLHGAEVLAPTCDLTSADAVRSVAAAFAGDGASLVIHAAGAATFGLHDTISPASFADTAAAKVSGLARITELWPLRPGAPIVACSSVSGVWGGRGHAAYSAANRMLDVMAGQLRANGTHCVAVKYGLWGSGIVGADEVARIERSGLLSMPPDAAIAASLSEHGTEPLILAADRDRLETFFVSQQSIETGSGTVVSDVDTATRVRIELAAVLKLNDTAAIDLDASLVDLGIDSLLALDLRKRLRKTTGNSVALAALLGGITGSELVSSIDNPEKVESPSD
jgi:mycobactin polyketide synthetase MbtD